MDRVRVQVADVYNHTVLHSVEVEWSQVLLHLGDDFTLFIFQGEPEKLGFGSVSFLNVLFEGQNGRIGINSEFWDLKWGKVMF